MGSQKKPSEPAAYGRRGFLEWLGKGTVIGLGGSFLASCLTGVGLDEDGGFDGGGSDGGGDGGGGGGDFPFSPSTSKDGVLNGWPERTVDKQDLAEILQNWRLTVDGLVESPRVFTFAELVDLPRVNPLVDFHCVEGWSVLDVPWNGLHLSSIFDLVKPLARATHVTYHTLGGRYNENHPITVAREPKTLLAYGIEGNTIPLKHGFPLRIVIPRLLGYKSAKFVERIELTDGELYGYWVAAGYPYAGEVPASRLRPGKY